MVSGQVETLTSHDNYSALDRLLHRIAFMSWSLQFSAADIEKAFFGARFRDVRIERPIFITSLPRAGTTLLLELMNRLPELATHRYRDMPLVMAPILWETMSKRFRKVARPTERAHGDGMQVGYDSPEALEEVVWRAFWPEKFGAATIELWSDQEVRLDFEAFYSEHIRKIIAVRSKAGARLVRYAAKNNANVARIGLLRRMFPDSLFLVPFRDPLNQAESLRRQHLRFLAMHRRDPFSKRYMRDIGHFEFGELRRPINFDGLGAILRGLQSTTLNYWIAYWVAAFNHIVSYRDSVVFVSYERLCEAGPPAFRSLEMRLGLMEHALEGATSMLRPPTRYECDIDELDPEVMEGAHTLHRELLSMSAL